MTSSKPAMQQVTNEQPFTRMLEEALARIFHGGETFLSPFARRRRQECRRSVGQPALPSHGECAISGLVPDRTPILRFHGLLRSIDSAVFRFGLNSISTQRPDSRRFRDLEYLQEIAEGAEGKHSLWIFSATSAASCKKVRAWVRLRRSRSRFIQQVSNVARRTRSDATLKHRCPERCGKAGTRRSISETPAH